MKILPTSLVLAGCLAASAFPAAGDGSPQDPNLLYVGRWDDSDPARPHSHWGGAYVRTRFVGTGISAKLSQKASVVVHVDSRPAAILANVSGTVRLASNLAAGEHTVQLVAKFQDDELAFEGFVLDAGAKTLPADRSKILVEFIGNSITSGTATTNGNISAFPWLVSDALGVERTTISYPGITLVRGCSYSFQGSPTIGQEVQYFKLGKSPLYPVTTPSGAGAKDWDFNRYVADLVVINLGTNDRNLNVPGPAFQSAYVRFLQAIRSRFPQAQIFALRTFGNHFPAETEAAVNEVVGAGDKRVHYVNTDGWLASSDYADGVHPTDAGHRKVANRLVPILKPYIDSTASVAVTPPAVSRTFRTPRAIHSTRLAPGLAVDGRHGGRPGGSATAPWSVATP